MSHTCPTRGCSVTIRDDSILMCKQHWFELMREERAAVMESYKRNGAGFAHMQTIQSILDRQATRLERTAEIKEMQRGIKPLKREDW